MPPPPLNASTANVQPPPDPAKQPDDVPDVEELGPINWSAMQERERSQMRVACVLIESQKQRIQRLEGDKTITMKLNMMAQDRVRAMQLPFGGSASSSSAAPPPPSTSGQHQ